MTKSDGVMINQRSWIPEITGGEKGQMSGELRIRTEVVSEFSLFFLLYWKFFSDRLFGVFVVL